MAPLPPSTPSARSIALRTARRHTTSARRAVLVTRAMCHSLESRTLLSALVYNGGSGDKVVRVALSGTDVVIYRDGQEAARAPLATTDSLVIDLGSGDDQLRIESNVNIPATVDASSGHDTVFGGPADDVIYGSSGNDVLRGGGGNDRLDGGTGDDRLFGEAGDDFLSEPKGGQHDELDGGPGNDTLTGGPSPNLSTLRGGPGDDRLEGGAGDDLLLGGTGADTYVFSGSEPLGTDRIEEEYEAPDPRRFTTFDFSGLGQGITLDTARAIAVQEVAPGQLSLLVPPPERYERVIGTDFADVIRGSNGDSDIDGRAGDDRLFGTGDADTLHGGDGADVLDGGTDDDTLDGGPGDDTLIGSSGDNRLDGGAGADKIDSGGGADVVYGGAGSDTISTGGGDDIVYGDGGKIGNANEAGAGNDVIDSGSEADVVYGGGGDDRITTRSERDTAWGDYESIAPDFPFSRDGNDTLVGGGSDTLYGDSAGSPAGFRHGDDTLFTSGGNPDWAWGDSGPFADHGVPGNDTLVPLGPGSAVLIGQGGDDTYRFFNDRNPLQQNGTVEVMEDDSTSGAGGHDTLDFSGLRLRPTETVGASIDLGSPEPQRVVESRLYFFLHNTHSIEDVIGSDYPDRITGNDLPNQLDGGRGDDTISGGAGDDALIGGPGRDVLRGDAGDDLLLARDRERDTLYGGPGTDTSRVSRQERDGFDRIPDDDIEYATGPASAPHTLLQLRTARLALAQRRLRLWWAI